MFDCIDRYFYWNIFLKEIYRVKWVEYRFMSYIIIII